MKDRLGGKIITKFVGLRVKTYSYLTNDDSKDKKSKRHKKCHKKKTEIWKLQQLFRSSSNWK